MKCEVELFLRDFDGIQWDMSLGIHENDLRRNGLDEFAVEPKTSDICELLLVSGTFGNQLLLGPFDIQPVLFFTQEYFSWLRILGACKWESGLRKFLGFPDFLFRCYI